MRFTVTTGGNAWAMQSTSAVIPLEMSGSGSTLEPVENGRFTQMTELLHLLHLLH
ncbi:MAG: hypothetical protein ACREJ2_12420 [Planctomycetota bacterium]